MKLKNFDQIVEHAKRAFRKERVVIAGADAENILLGAFEVQDAGFAALTLVGEKEKILPMLECLGLKDKEYRLVETGPEDNVTQVAIDLIMSKEAARLKGVAPELSGEFDGIVMPNLLAGNLIVKSWQMYADPLPAAS